jgi:hypothetical protein
MTVATRRLAAPMVIAPKTQGVEMLTMVQESKFTYTI